MAWRTLLVSLMLTLTSSLGLAQESLLRVELAGLDGVSGTVYISVYDDVDTWLGDNVVEKIGLEIDAARQGELVVAELALAAGDYALAIHYDLNGNGELDTNFLRIPQEPVAFSNNARPSFGPPKYEDALFTLSGSGLSQRITLDADE